MLSALAHRAGFAFVFLGAAADSVYVSVAQADQIEVKVVGGTATGADGMAARVGETLVLQATPPIGRNTAYRWKTITAGTGHLLFTTPPDQSTVTVEVTSAGPCTVKVEAIRNHRLISASREFRLGLQTLDDNRSIGEDGTLAVTEELASAPEDFFHEAYLINHDDPRVDYGADIQRHRVHPAVGRRLDRLLALAPPLPAGQIVVVEAVSPGASGLKGTGRALTLEPANPALFPPGRLGALAYAANFTFVRRQGNQILVRQTPDDLMTVFAGGNVTEVAEGDSVDLSCSPRARPRAIAVKADAVFVANEGTQTVSELDPATGQVRRAIKVGGVPLKLAVSADGATVYTANSGAGTTPSITSITLATGGTRETPAPAGLTALIHHPTLARLYAAAFGPNQVVQFDSATMAALGSATVSAGPVALAVIDTLDELWVVSQTAQQISILKASTLTLLATIALPSNPRDIAIAPDHARAYVTLPGVGAVLVVDVGGRTVLGQFAAGGVPTALSMDPSGATLCVADDQSLKERLQVLEPLSVAPFLKERGTLRMGQQPMGVTATADAAYVTDRSLDVLQVVDLAAATLRHTQSWHLGSGLGERLTWVLHGEGEARARLGSVTEPEIKLTAERAGRVIVRALYSRDLEPYAFEVRLKKALEDASAIVTKAQYDLIMNVLNAFHPIGVEVITRAIRERVIEIGEGLINAFPDYTYPNFRGRVPARSRRAIQPSRPA